MNLNNFQLILRFLMVLLFLEYDIVSFIERRGLFS